MASGVDPATTPAPAVAPQSARRYSAAARRPQEAEAPLLAAALPARLQGRDRRQGGPESRHCGGNGGGQMPCAPIAPVIRKNWIGSVEFRSPIRAGVANVKTLIGTAAATAVATFALMQAFGANAPNRPPGVSADEWAPINDTVGVVLVQGMIPTGAQRHQPPRAGILPNIGAALVPPVSGYLMVRRGHTWQRLVVIDPVKGPGDAG